MRWEYDPETGQQMKVFDKFKFDVDIDLTKFVTPPTQILENKLIK